MPAPSQLLPPPRLDQAAAAQRAAVRERIGASARFEVQDGAQGMQFQAMGTRCAIRYAAPSGRAEEINRMVLDWVADFESKYSRFLPESLISRINQAAGRAPVAVDPETDQLLGLCDQMHFITGGVFDPTSLPLVALWNWKAGAIPSPAEMDAARSLVGWRKVQRRPGRVFLPAAGMGLDLGGMGKEYAVDRVAQMLAGAGVSGALVDFGADVRVVGRPPDGRPGWHIGLEDPKQPGRCWCGLGLREGAVATSGDYLRSFEKGGRRYGHILDIRTGQPVSNGCRAVSVLAPSCTLAGMLSTAVFVLGPEVGLRLLEAQFESAGAIVTDQSTMTSRRFYEHVVS